MTTIGTATLRLLGDTAQFRKELTGASKQWAKTGQQMEAAGKKLTMGLTLPLIAAAGGIAVLGTSFEAEMSKIVGLVGISQEQVAQWSDQLLELGPKVGKSPRELAEALFFVTSAGFRGAAAIDVLTIAAKASAAGLGETAIVADAVTSAINAYGMENLSATDAANILTAAVREGKLEASQLAPVLGQVLPTASALGIAFEDVAGVLAVFSRTGVNAAEGATGLNAVLSTLLSTSAEGERALDGVGLSLEGLRKQAQGADGVVGVMRTLDEAFKGNNDEIIKVIPNIRAFRGVMNVLAQDSETVDSVMRGVANSTGALDNAFQAAADTNKFKFNASMSEIAASMIKISASVLPPLATGLAALADIISTVADGFSGLPGPLRAVTVALLALAAATGPLLMVAGKLVAAIGFLGPAFAALGPAIALIVTPVTLAVAAFAALVIAGMLVYKNWDFLKSAAGSLWEWIKSAFSLGIEFVKFLIDDFIAGVVDRFLWLKDIIVGNSIVPDMMAAIGQEFGGLDKLMVAPAEEATAAVTKAFENIVGPGKVKGINYAVSIDANELYGAVIEATGSAAVAFNALSDEVPPTAELFVQLQKEIEGMKTEGRSWTQTAEDMKRAGQDLHFQILSTVGVEKVAADQMRTVGNEAVTMSAKNQASIDAQVAALRSSELSLRVHQAVTDTLNMASAETAFKFEALQRSAAGIISDFTPMGMLATVLGSALEALKPAFDALQAPLKILGVILAAAIMPILKALFPVIKFLSIAASYVVEGFLWLAGISLKVSGWLMNAIGTFVFGLGKMLSKIPLIGGIFKPMKAAGKAMMDYGQAQMDAGEGMLDAIDDVRAGREEIRALEWPEEAEAAAQAGVSATEGTTEAVGITTEAVRDVGSQLVETAVGILEAMLSMRDLTVRGVDYLALLAGPGGVLLSPANPVLSPAGPGAMFSGTGIDGAGKMIVTVGEGAVQIIVGDRDDPRAAGVAAADGFMETISGRQYERTKREISGSGRIEREI